PGWIADEDAPGSLTRLLPRVRDRRGDPVALPLVRQDERRMPQRRGALGRGRGAAALPGVRADVVVVPAGGEERRGRAELGHQLEAEDAVVEGDGVGDVG